MPKKNLSSRAISKGTESDPFASGMTELQAGVKMKSTNVRRKAGIYKRRRSNRVAQQNDLQKDKNSAASDKACADEGNFPQLHRENTSGVGVQENTLSPVVCPAVAPSPSFTYDVYCEDGIQLFVDLNSSLSNWIENLKAEVHNGHYMHEPMSQSFHQDIDPLCNSKQKNDSVIIISSDDEDNGQLEVGSHATNVAADTQDQIVQLERLKSSSTQDRLPGVHSNRREETLAADSSLDVVVKTGLCCELTPNSVPSDPKCLGFSLHQGSSTGNNVREKPFLLKSNGLLDAAVKCGESSTFVCADKQKSTCDALIHDSGYSPFEVYRCVDSTKQLKNNEVVKFGQTSVQEVDQSKYLSSSPNSCSLDLPYKKRSKFRHQQGIASLFRKADGQIKEGQAHSTENGGFPRTEKAGSETDEEQMKDAALCLVVLKHNYGDLGKSTELNEDDTCRILSTADGATDDGNGNEGLKCFNSKDKLEIPCERPGTKSKGELKANSHAKKKSHATGIEGRSKFINSEEKNSRSSKQFGDVRPKRKRSSRLFAK